MEWLIQNCPVKRIAAPRHTHSHPEKPQLNKNKKPLKADIFTKYICRCSSLSNLWLIKRRETKSLKQFVLCTTICGKQEEGGRQLSYFAMWLFHGFPETRFQPLMKTAETSVAQHSPHHWVIVIMVLRDGDNWSPQPDRSAQALLWDSCVVAVHSVLTHRPLRFSRLHIQLYLRDMCPELQHLLSPHLTLEYQIILNLITLEVPCTVEELLLSIKILI